MIFLNLSAAVVSLLMLTTGCYLQLCGGKLTEGIFVGVFLSMSSTAVVTLYRDLSLGWPPLLFLYNYFITLMDDTSCWAVGVKIFDGEEQHKFPSWPSYHRNPYFAGMLFIHVPFVGIPSSYILSSIMGTLLKRFELRGTWSDFNIATAQWLHCLFRSGFRCLTSFIMLVLLLHFI